MSEKNGAEEPSEAKLARLREVLDMLPAKYGVLPLGVAPQDRWKLNEVIQEIGEIGGQQAYELLTQLLMDHTYRSFILNTADALRHMGKSLDAAQLVIREYPKLPHLPLIDAHEESLDASPQALYIRALAFLQESCALPFLTTILEYYFTTRQHTELARSVIHALAYIGDFTAFDLLLRAAQETRLEHTVRIGLGILCGVTERTVHFPERIRHAIPKLKEALERHQVKYPEDRGTLVIGKEVLARAQKTLKIIQTNGH